MSDPKRSYQSAQGIDFGDPELVDVAAQIMASMVRPSFGEVAPPDLIAALVMHAAMGAAQLPIEGWTRVDFVELAGRAYDLVVENRPRTGTPT